MFDDETEAVRVPLPAKLEDVTLLVGGILRDKNVYRVLLEADGGIKYWPNEEEGPGAPLEDVDVFAATRNVDMRDFVAADHGLADAGADQILFWMAAFLTIEKKLQPAFLITHPNSLIWKWLGLPGKVGARLKSLLGMPVFTHADVPRDVFLLAGAAHRWAPATDIRFSLRYLIPSTNVT